MINIKANLTGGLITDGSITEEQPKITSYSFSIESKTHLFGLALIHYLLLSSVFKFLVWF